MRLMQVPIKAMDIRDEQIQVELEKNQGINSLRFITLPFSRLNDLF
jgi:hypothetical protein